MGNFMNKDLFIEWAVKNHWSVTKKERAEVRINDAVRQKYKELPQEYLAFIEGLEEVVSPKDTTWFLCESDYNNTSASSYQWNEFESLELKAAADDRECAERIREWWSRYFPIMLSVDGGYSYWAIYICDRTVVRGSEPEFEAVEKAADSFDEFLSRIMDGKIGIV